MVYNFICEADSHANLLIVTQSFLKPGLTQTSLFTLHWYIQFAAVSWCFNVVFRWNPLEHNIEQQLKALNWTDWVCMPNCMCNCCMLIGLRDYKLLNEVRVEIQFLFTYPVSTPSVINPHHLVRGHGQVSSGRVAKFRSYICSVN